MATNKTRAADLPDEKKEKYWGEARNERRRARYADDPEYKREVLQRARQTQFNKRREQGMDVREGENCRVNLPKLARAERRDLLIGDRVRLQAHGSLTVEELAVLLERDPQVLYRWMNRKDEYGRAMLPRPLFEALNDRNRRQAVYTVEEARAIMTQFSIHQDSSLYYRASHVETVANLTAAVNTARGLLGVTDDVDSEAAVH